MAEKEYWGSRLGLILASIGYAVGMGNIWRFPYMVGQHGGGVFLVVYFLAVILIAIPLFSIEVAMGKASGHAPAGAYRALRPKGPWFLNGHIHVLVNLIATGFTAPVAGWIIAYLVKTPSGLFSGMGAEEVEAYFGAFSNNSLEVMGWTTILIVLIVLVLIRGLNRGLERMNKMMMPALLVLLLVLIIRGLTLEGAGQGVLFYLKPDFSKFTFQAIPAAVGQAFFSVGVAFGAAMVFGSYMRPKERVVSNAMIIGFSDMAVATLAGFLVFPIVFAFGLEPQAGIGLVFITMPNIFNQMPFGEVFAVLFYLLFFLAAFSSFLGGTEAIAAHFRELWNLSRARSLLVTAGMVMTIAVLSSTSTEVLARIDYIAINAFLIFGALMMVVFVGWVWPIEGFLDTAGLHRRGARIFWTGLIKYFAPAAIIVIWLSQLNIIKTT